MASPDPSAKPTPSSGATLAPPSQISRPSSANSNSSRRGRSNGSKSGGTSRSNSHSSRGDGNSRVSSGNTTTIGGGVKLGSPVNKDDGKVGGEKKDTKKPNRGNRKKQHEGKRPQPIDTNAPPRSVSANSTRSESQPRVLHAHISPPRTALDAALELAKKKLVEKDGSGDALTSLQKMISDLKAISPSSAVPPSLPSGSTSGRSMSMSQGDRSTSQSIPSAPSPLEPLPLLLVPVDVLPRALSRQVQHPWAIS
jgi:protein SSD1